MYPFLSLEELQRQLNDIVIGQEEAVRKISVTIYKHIIRAEGALKGIQIDANSNLLVLGETGSGKTYLVRNAAKLIQLPFIEINSKAICQEGWAGNSLLNLIKEGLESNDHMANDILNYSIIFLDEFDKICTPLSSDKRENYNEAIQHTMLKYVEGMRVSIGRKEFDTSKFLFIFGGSFEDVRKPPKEATSIGFLKDKKKEVHKGIKDIHKKLIEFGMLPELAGRIRSNVVLNPFTKEMFEKTLSNDNFHINKWIQLLSRYNVDVTLSNKIIKKALDDSENKGLGCRGFIQSLEEYIDEVIYKNSDKL